MTKTFVFGKFLPFHKGHEAMIHFALTQGDFLTVLVCCSDKEHIPHTVREGWIKETFGQEKRLEIKTLHYQESELPNTSVASKEVSEVWSSTFKKIFPDYDLLITSEPYGEFVAEFMQIRHLAFDMGKKKFPISATMIRKDLVKHWEFLPDSVKPFFITKVVLLGTESTGKTTLTEKLTEHYRCTKVLEAARELIPDSKHFSMEDLHSVAAGHAKKIEKAVKGNSALVIIDTDIHTTKSYSEFIFNQALEIQNETYETNRSDLYLYLNNDVAYVQDGTRLSEEERNLLDRSHRKILKEHHIAIVEIKGDWGQRFEKAVKEIDALMALRKQSA